MGAAAGRWIVILGLPTSSGGLTVAGGLAHLNPGRMKGEDDFPEPELTAR